ncbi:hypothetical protein BGZ49_003297 [Haplosporangium sp. Z 27]|nr:hypothetical protein BGZ49_003297 [Haplosporangium sp. Z 27]
MDDLLFSKLSVTPKVPPVIRFFSIPEIVEHVNRFLRPMDHQNLRLVSKTLYSAFLPTLQISLSLTSKSLNESVLSSADIPSLAPRVRGLSLDIHSDQSSSSQKSLLETIYKHCVALENLNIEYGGDDMTALKEILSNLPWIRNLSLTFEICPDFPLVLKTLIEARKAIIKHGIDDSNLRSLEIIMKVEVGQGYATWLRLKRIFKFYPELESLSLQGVMLWKWVSRSLTAGDDDVDDFKDDFIDAADKLQYTNMKTLKLTKCSFAEICILDMNIIFPMLRSLELVGCDPTWIRILERPLSPLPTQPSATQSTQDVLAQEYSFPELRNLVFWLEYQSGRVEFKNLVLGRPHLSSLETDLLPLTRTSLMDLAECCSGSTPSDTVSSDTIYANTTSLVKTAPVAHKFKRLAIQTYSSPPQPAEALERFYGSLCFNELDYVFVQNRTLSMKLFPFAKTLTRLYIGGEESILNETEENMLRSILRELPVLETLRIDRYLSSYRTFQGLGRAPEPSYTNVADLTTEATDLTDSTSDLIDHSSVSELRGWDWIKEGPFLRDLEFYVRLPIGLAGSIGPTGSLLPWSLEKRIGDVNQLNLEVLERKIIYRFRFLERLKLHVGGAKGQLKIPDSEELEQWRKKVQRGRGGEGGRLFQVEFVTR